jgi:CRISPR-associated protein Cmr6
MKNAGWLFYRNYYSSLQSGTEGESRLESFIRNGHLRINNEPKDKVFFKTESDELLGFAWDSVQNQYFAKDRLQSFQFETTYPGLLVGSGYSHQTGSMGEFKLGFFFDHTTGLPILPGSSVKGLLRSAFPNQEKRGAVKKRKAEFIGAMLRGIRQDLSSIKAQSKEEEELVSQLEYQIFEGILKNEEYLPMYKHDVFHDAFIVGTSKGNRGKIFGEDYITPHLNPLKNPIPVRFMKILPGVSFQFNFDLKDSRVGNLVLSAQEKCELFKQIILLFGIGAKTNVGYGQFV